jgi:hypothetical protein
MTVLSALKKDFRNPLIPNFRNQRAIDLANDPILKADIITCMQFRLKRKVMQWFGPLFRKRVFAFLLVLKRLKMGFTRRSIAAGQIHEQSRAYLHSVSVMRIP